MLSFKIAALRLWQMLMFQCHSTDAMRGMLMTRSNGRVTAHVLTARRVPEEGGTGIVQLLHESGKTGSSQEFPGLTLNVALLLSSFCVAIPASQEIKSAPLIHQINFFRPYNLVHLPCTSVSRYYCLLVSFCLLWEVITYNFLSCFHCGMTQRCATVGWHFRFIACR